MFANVLTTACRLGEDRVEQKYTPIGKVVLVSIMMTLMGVFLCVILGLRHKDL